MSPKRLPPALLALSPGDLSPEQVPAFLARCAQALAGGLRGVLLREPRLADRVLLDLARALRALLDPLDGWLAVHDRAHLVAPARADGLHLGFRSLRASEARGLVGDGVAIGCSTHRGDPPDSFAAADYRFFGPLRPVAGKLHPVEPVGLDGVEGEVGASAAGIPVWILGGVRVDDAGELRRRGAAGLAVLSGVLGATDPAAAASAYLEAWTRAEGAG